MLLLIFSVYLTSTGIIFIDTVVVILLLLLMLLLLLLLLLVLVVVSLMCHQQKITLFPSFVLVPDEI